MPSCLQLAGSLSVTQESLNDVGTLMVQEVDMLMVETLRTASTASGTFTYYIDCLADLNALITYTASATGNYNDDAYAFSGFTRSNDASANIFLPSASGKSVPAGLVDAFNAVRDISAGSFPVGLTIGVSDVGLMSASILISGNDVTSNVEDSNLYAQVAYWDISANALPTPTATSADVLDATITASELTTQFSSELATILAYYDQHQMIDAWTVAISAIPSSNNNNLAKHARMPNSAGNINTGNSNVFLSGDKVMAITPFSYGVSIKNYLGNSVEIVAPQNVFGVVTQL